MTPTRNPARTENPTPHMSAGKLYTAQRYVVGWQDGIVKVGSTMTGRARWGIFLNRGARMLDLAQYQKLCDDLEAETWLHHQIACMGYKKAFESVEQSTQYLGPRGRGYLECYRIPVEDWPKIIEIARTEDALV